MENAVLLLDEPGLHLHAAAQRDLLKRMHAYADKNQLIYTTHLPFMIDLKRLDNIYVAEDVEKHGTKLHQNWAGANDDAKFTLQSALGLSWSQSLFVGPYNLVVEGVDDFWLLTTFSTLFEEAGEPGIDPRLVINPAGGASKVAYIGTILKAQELEVAVFLDSDFAGKSAFQQLVHEKILKHNRVVMLGDVIGKELCAIEDLFEEKYYIGKVNEAYKKELTDKLLKLNTHTSGKKTLVDRVEEGLKELNIETFNKGRVAKLIMSDLGSKKLSAVNPKTVENFRLVFSAINKLWKSPEK